MEDILYRILSVLLTVPTVLIALSFHECAHAFVAYKLGDPTAKYMGRLTLNPIKHLDPIGAICMLFCGFGWAKSVPVNMMKFKKPKIGMAITALAGPVTNIILGFIGCFLYAISIRILSQYRMEAFAYYVADAWCLFAYSFGYLNIFLAIFNLIPVPPFDGSRIWGAFLSDRLYLKFISYERYIGIGFFAIYLLDSRLNGPISHSLSWLVNGIFNTFCSIFI